MSNHTPFCKALHVDRACETSAEISALACIFFTLIRITSKVLLGSALLYPNLLSACRKYKRRHHADRAEVHRVVPMEVVSNPYSVRPHKTTENDAGGGQMKDAFLEIQEMAETAAWACLLSRSASAVSTVPHSSPVG